MIPPEDLKKSIPESLLKQVSQVSKKAQEVFEENDILHTIQLSKLWLDYSEGSPETKVNFILDQLMKRTNKNSITSIIIPNCLQRVVPRFASRADRTPWTQESAKLASVLSQYPNLTHLDLSENNIHWIELLQIVTSSNPVSWECTSLTHLDLQSCDIFYNGGLDMVTRILAQWKCEKLTHLNLANNNIYNIFQTWTPLLQQFTELRHLNLNTNFMNERSSTVADGLSRCTTLTRLEMHDNHMQAEGMRSLAPVLQRCPELTHLMLGNNQIGNDGADHLAGVFSICTKLVHVHLGGGNRIEVTVQNIFLSSLSRCTLITHLDLSCTILHVEGTRLLAQALCPLSVLADLNLDFTQMTDGGAQNLATYLPQYSALKKLGIAGNSITAAGTTHLIPAMLQCSKLMSLDIRANQIGTAAQDLVTTCLQLTNDSNKFELNISFNDLDWQFDQQLEHRCRGTQLDYADVC